MLKKSGMSGHPCLVADPRVKAFTECDASRYNFAGHPLSREFLSLMDMAFCQIFFVHLL